MHPDPDRPADLRVLTFNVLTSNSDHAEVLDYLAGSDADLILVIETNRTWLEALAPLKTHYPHVLAAPREDNFGMSCAVSGARSVPGWVPITAPSWPIWRSMRAEGSRLRSTAWSGDGAV